MKALLALVLATGLALGAVAAPGAAALPPDEAPGARWVDADHDANATEPCCAHARVRANATDPDQSGLYDTSDASLRANATPPKDRFFPKPGPGVPAGPRTPVVYFANLSANASAWDSRVRDLPDNLTANASADANLTLVSPAKAPIAKRSVAVGARCENRDRTIGPESCAPPAASTTASARAPDAPSPEPKPGTLGKAPGKSGPTKAKAPAAKAKPQPAAKAKWLKSPAKSAPPPATEPDEGSKSPGAAEKGASSGKAAKGASKAPSGARGSLRNR